MQTLGQRQLLSFVSPAKYVRVKTNHEIRARRGLEIQSYPELVERVSQLSFHNPEQVLFFRGQKQEYTNRQNNTSIKPSLFRPLPGSRTSPDAPILRRRYERLRRAELEIVNLFRNGIAVGKRRVTFLGKERVTRSRILQWAIIQHYEICGTPLLDVTHSLRVAASFATLDKTAANPLVYVLAAPALGGTISASSEQGLQTIRLSSICPPDARRPYFQEGYLLGEYPDLVSFDEKQNYAPSEIDFGLRLLAKFHLRPKTFWSDKNFSPIPEAALFPNGRDPLFTACRKIKERLGPE